jgi:predicted HTH domain antitoxin
MLTASGKSLTTRGIISLGVSEMKQVNVFVPDEVVSLLGFREKDLSKELLVRFAITLYGEGRVSLGKAVEISGLAYADFMEFLADYGLGINYGMKELEEDLRTLKEIDALEENRG